MKKLVLVLAICLCLPALAAAKDFTVRDGMKWGMAKAEVEKAETAMWLGKDDTTINYNVGLILGIPARVNYIFTQDDKLAAVEYVITPEQEIEVLAKSYEKIRNAVASKYGLPVKSDIMYNSMYYYTEWSLDDTVISAKMYGYSNNYSIYVKYAAKAYAEALNAESAARVKAEIDKVF